MRDAAIAALVLGLGAYGAWSYAPTQATASLAIAVADGESGAKSSSDVSIARSSVALPPRNPWRVVPAPLARPSATLADGATGRAEARRFAPSAAVIHPGLIEIDGRRYALYGVDGPAGDQTCRNAASGLWACGTAARKATAGFIADRDVDCTALAAPIEGRPVTARCEVGGADLGAWTVSQGWAMADAAVDLRYVDAQNEARRNRAGLWSGWFETPTAWRAREAAPDVRIASGLDDRV